MGNQKKFARTEVARVVAQEGLLAQILAGLRTTREKIRIFCPQRVRFVTLLR